jgi:hypothetical protein
MTIDELSHGRATVPNEPGDLLDRHAGVRKYRNEVVPQFAWGPFGWIDAGDQSESTTEVPPNVPCGHLGSDRGREDELGLLPALPGRQSIGQLLRPLSP